MIGAPTDGTPDDYNLIGIGESGSSRHEIIQTYISTMQDAGFDCEWVDVAEYINQTKPEGTTVIKKSGMETKCHNDIFNMRFLCDGVIKYKGKYYIIEIKTESTYKYSSHDDVYLEHKAQATCYSMALGIDEVIFLYEDRDNCSKKAYYVEVTDAMKQDIAGKIFQCDECVKTSTPPPKTDIPKHCDYCKYKRQCREVENVCKTAKSGKTISVNHSKGKVKIEF
jgi:RecB family exonuclease